MHAREFLGLMATHNPHRWYLPVERKLTVREGFLFGGCGLAAAVTAMEITTGRYQRCGLCVAIKPRNSRACIGSQA